MKIKTIKVSEKGQIAIPAEFREIIGIHKGDQLLLIQKGNKILIEKTASFSEEIKNGFEDLIKFSEKNIKKLWDNKEDDVWNKYLET